MVWKRGMLLKNVELLSPAGSYESGVAAIQNGCDALYLAGKQFGARAFAANFEKEQLQEMITYAHAYGVKVYVTINTLVHDEEMNSFFAYLDFLYTAKVDALIVQDLGIVYQIRTRYPDFEVHASTQMHIVNEQALRLLIDQGISRAVLAREVNIDEITRFSTLPIELEVFVHGALCVSYSGQCLMSFMVGGRSGNRGACAQSCRMPYALKEWNTNTVYKEGYHLSLKDLNTLEEVPSLVKAGIASFKMEGRMKKSEYVAHLTALYRQRIDTPAIPLTDLQNQVAKTLFHRGFSRGHLFKETGSKLYNPIRPNHIGIPIGEVVAFKGNQVFIRLQAPLHQLDGIRILNAKEDVGYKVNRLYKDGLLVNKAEANDIIALDSDARHLKVKDQVVKTSDCIAEKEIQKTYDRNYRKVAIHGKVKAHAKQPLRVIVSDALHTVEMCSDCIQVAQNRATTKEEVEKQMQKTKDTIFAFVDIDIEMDTQLFIPIKEINQLRREALDKLYALRSNNCERVTRQYTLPTLGMMQTTFTKEAKVRTQSQLEACMECGMDAIYVEDYALWKANAQYPQVKLVSKKAEKGTYENVTMIQEIGGLHALSSMVCDTSLNAYNAHACFYLHALGASLIALSLELSKWDIQTLMDTYVQEYGNTPSLQKVVYGRSEVMLMEHCPIHAHFLDKDKQNCHLCKQKQYALEDQFHNEYVLQGDGDCRMHVYDYKILDERKDIAFYQTLGIQSIRYDFTFETKEEVLTVLQEEA